MIIFFFHFWFHGLACKLFGRGGAKYINLIAKSKFFMLIYIIGNFFSKARGGGGGAWPPWPPSAPS